MKWGIFCGVIGWAFVSRRFGRVSGEGRGEVLAGTGIYPRFAWITMGRFGGDWGLSSLRSDHNGENRGWVLVGFEAEFVEEGAVGFVEGASLAVGQAAEFGGDVHEVVE